MIRDLSIITGGGGGLQNGKIAGLKLFARPPPPPHSRQGKTFRSPSFKARKLFAAPFSMDKTPPIPLFCTVKISIATAPVL